MGKKKKTVLLSALKVNMWQRNRQPPTLTTGDCFYLRRQLIAGRSGQTAVGSKREKRGGESCLQKPQTPERERRCAEKPRSKD